MNEYDIGDRVLLSVRFSDPSQPKDPITNRHPPVDPTTVECFVRGPSSQVLPVSPVTNPEPGTYEAEFAPADPGTWQYRFTGTGSFVAAAEGSFRVRRSAFV